MYELPYIHRLKSVVLRQRLISATINANNSKNPEKYLFDGAIGKSYNKAENLWIQSPHPGYVTFLQNLSNLDIPDKNLVSFIQKNTATYGYTWEKDFIKRYKEPKIISTTPKPRTNAQYYSQGDLDARNSAVVKGGGGVDLRSGKERQADSDKPMQEKVVPVIQGGVGLAEIYGGTIICTSGIGCTLGGIAIVNGTDNVATAKRNYNKSAKDQVPSAALEAAGVSKSTASKVKIVSDLASGGALAAGSKVATATKVTNAAREAEVNTNRINNNFYSEGGLSDPHPISNTNNGQYATISTNAAKNTETYFRVQGGGTGTAISQERITVNKNGSISINSGCSGQLCVSTNGSEHAVYYLTNKRPDGNVVVFELDKDLHDFIMEEAVAQDPKFRPPNSDRNAPKITDETTAGTSLELPKIWDSLIEQHSSNARVLSQDEFLKEFGGDKK